MSQLSFPVLVIQGTINASVRMTVWGGQKNKTVSLRCKKERNKPHKTEDYYAFWRLKMPLASVWGSPKQKPPQPTSASKL